VETILLVVHVLLSLGIIGLVLLQRGKGADAGAALGGGASATVFGARGAANFLSRSTAILATAFFISSLTLAYLASQREAPSSVAESVATPTAVEQQAKPAGGEDMPEADTAPAAPAGADLPPAAE
jgi:preprotein translocase subunit SecG